MWLNCITPMLLAAAEAAPAGPREAAPGWEQDAERFLFLVVDIGFVTIALGSVICLFRLLRGPSLIDRGVASDGLAFQVVGLAILMTVRFQSMVAFDAVLILAFLGFVGTIAFAQYVGRRRSAL